MEFFNEKNDKENLRNEIVNTWEVLGKHMVCKLTYKNGKKIGEFYIPHKISEDVPRTMSYIYKVIDYYEIAIADNKKEVSCKKYTGNLIQEKIVTYEPVVAVNGDEIYVIVKYNNKRIGVIHLPVSFKYDTYNTDKLVGKIGVYYKRMTDIKK